MDHVESEDACAALDHKKDKGQESRGSEDSLGPSVLFVCSLRSSLMKKMKNTSEERKKKKKKIRLIQQRGLFISKKRRFSLARN